MNVLVIGANGKIGRLLVEKLAMEKGFFVRAMVRKAEQVSELEKLGAKPIIADLKKISTMPMMKLKLLFSQQDPVVIRPLPKLSTLTKTAPSKPSKLLKKKVYVGSSLLALMAPTIQKTVPNPSSII